jgi:hypothetical protein
VNLQTQKDIKAIYRVTGTPENFLTALRYSVWGFNPERKKDWQKLMPGDIIFFHSKSSDSQFLPHPPSCIIGFGVVGNNFYEDDIPLWIDEKLENKHYPYKFSFSEVYLFSPIPINDEWDSTTLNKVENTIGILKKLLEAGIPLSELDGFPKMGSYSRVNKEDVKSLLLNSLRNLSFYEGSHDENVISKSAGLEEFTNEIEAFRFGTTLTVFDDIKQRILHEPNSTHLYNADKLAKAEISHFDIVAYLRLLLASKGYKVFYNNHVDLYAHNNENSFLVEAKSVQSKNFISQSRKGVIQLFEYNYFEIGKFKLSHDLEFRNEVKLLATSHKPKDNSYVDFINSMDIRTIAIRNESQFHYGNSIDFSQY